MEQQSSRSTLTSTGPSGSAGASGSDGASDGPAWIKQEPEDDFTQTVENHSTDKCDSKEDIINIAPIVTNQTEIYKIEDTTKMKLETPKMGCPLWESSFQPVVKLERFSIKDIAKVKLETHKMGCPLWDSSFQPVVKLERCSIASDRKLSSKTINKVQIDDGLTQHIELPSELDCKDDVNLIDVGRSMPSDVEEKVTTQEKLPCDLECSDDMKTKGM